MLNECLKCSGLNTDKKNVSRGDLVQISMIKPPVVGSQEEDLKIKPKLLDTLRSKRKDS